MRKYLLAMACALPMTAISTGAFALYDTDTTESTSNSEASANSSSASQSSSQSSSQSKGTGIGVGIGVGGAGGAGGDGGSASNKSKQKTSVDVGSEVNVDTGGNTYEGDVDAASSAASVAASQCVGGAAAQAQTWGVSLGGITTDCRAQNVAEFYLNMADEAAERGDQERYDYYMELAYDSADEVNPTALQEAVHHVKEVFLDLAIPVGLLILLL